MFRCPSNPTQVKTENTLNSKYSKQLRCPKNPFSQFALRLEARRHRRGALDLLHHALHRHLLASETLPTDAFGTWKSEFRRWKDVADSG